MAIMRERITASPAAGSAGAATATGRSLHVVQGVIKAIHIAYLDSPPATTDVVISEDTATPGKTLFTVANANTDAWFYPMAAAVNQANAAITGQGADIAVADYVRVVIDQANSGDGVTVTIEWDDGR